MGQSDASKTWQHDHPWAVIYDRISGSDRLGKIIWRVGVGSDLGLLHRTASSELSDLPDGSAVLDIPCGGGVALRDIPHGRSLRYVAADISPAMLQRTKKEAMRRGVAVELAESDVHDLKFVDGTFSLVLAFTSLHCFPHPEQAVKEIARVLTPGGRLAGSSILTGERLRDVPVWLGGRRLGLLGPGCSAAELTRWLSESGMTDIVLRPSGGITYFTATRA